MQLLILNYFDLAAVSNRFLPLFATIVVEIPVLLMISRGGDRLCTLIGRTRYQLLLGFLPLSGAISGNCGTYSIFFLFVSYFDLASTRFSDE